MDSAFVRQSQVPNSRLRIVDGHCDTLQFIRRGTIEFRQGNNPTHLDLPRLKKGGVKVQFFAAFIHPDLGMKGVTRVLELVDAFHAFTRSTDGIRAAYGYQDILQFNEDGDIGAILTVEGGEALGESLGVLRMLHRLGVRVLTLTWNVRNALGDGVLEGEDRGLTGFGVEVVREMNRLGMIVDVSHLGPFSLNGVLDVSERPVLASHSNCHALCPHPRNLTDDQITAIAAPGGVIGATFVPTMVSRTDPSLERLLEHVDHLVRVGGIDCVAIGSDFDGFNGFLPGLKDAGEMGNLTTGLLERGYNEYQVEKVLGGNLLRLIKDVVG
ncbi:MAG: dipeptidase [Clostridia bacterium]|nr:dipeptidase [Clostridia bacterium]